MSQDIYDFPSESVFKEPEIKPMCWLCGGERQENFRHHVSICLSCEIHLQRGNLLGLVWTDADGRRWRSTRDQSEGYARMLPKEFS